MRGRRGEGYGRDMGGLEGGEGRMRGGRGEGEGRMS